MHAVARAFANCEQAVQRRATVEVGGDAAHRVVRRRGDRDQIASGIEPRTLQRRRNVREVRHVDPAEVEEDAGVGVRAHDVLDRQRDLVTRGQLVDETLA